MYSLFESFGYMQVTFTEYIASKAWYKMQHAGNDENTLVAMATHFNYLAKGILLTFFGCLATEHYCPDMNFG